MHDWVSIDRVLASKEFAETKSKRTSKFTECLPTVRSPLKYEGFAVRHGVVSKGISDTLPQPQCSRRPT